MRKPYLFLMLFFIATRAVFSILDNKDVEEKLELVLSEIDEDETPKEQSGLLNKIARFFAEIGWLFRFLFFLLVAALLLFLVYKIIGFFMPEKFINHSSIRGKKSQNKNSSEIMGKDRYLQKALDLFKKGDISAAVIALHRGSVRFLFNMSILVEGRDYTNREIFRILKGDNILKPFKTLALEAEIIRFKGIDADKSLFRSLEKTYMENFNG
ncbi:MAG: hypothetical protein GY756_25435 [bacterium]|nr:hypothetical protein [bacterium]